MLHAVLEHIKGDNKPLLEYPTPSLSRRNGSSWLSSRGDNLVIDEGRRKPSPPCGHLRLVRPKKEPVTPLVVKQEDAEMVADLNTGLKWLCDDYVRKERERQRHALEVIAA
ncbi:hypothetical protein D1007_03232 [Hordeum vulgare]|nr:hypothetical protein D1007_03232 [Hordeum vulgare]